MGPAYADSKGGGRWVNSSKHIWGTTFSFQAFDVFGCVWPRRPSRPTYGQMTLAESHGTGIMRSSRKNYYEKCSGFLLLLVFCRCGSNSKVEPFQVCDMFGLLSYEG